MTETEILARLIAFDTTSRNSNLGLLSYVQGLLRDAGLTPELFLSADDTKASLFVTAGPDGPGGILLSGHSDTVPVDGQNWTHDPFGLLENGGRLHGRGSADMKGFVACALSAMLTAARMPLRQPIHFALSYDEEIGCVGVRPMLDALAARKFRPSLCIIGEPTSMAVATGHKGKLAIRATCTGEAGHSAQAPNHANAIHLAADLLSLIRQAQFALQKTGHHDPAYDIPYTTLHAGVIHGGSALNIVPDTCQLDFEIRNLASDDAETILAGLQTKAEVIIAAARTLSPGADIRFEVINTYPGLDTPADGEGVALLQSLTGKPLTKVAFGTEGGLFARSLGCETIICGPGNMNHAHKSDEFVEVSQIIECKMLLHRLLERACL